MVFLLPIAITLIITMKIIQVAEKHCNTFSKKTLYSAKMCLFFSLKGLSFSFRVPREGATALPISPY
ncbi:hypothetical protein BHU62_15945 [Serratia marcescens]|uniref:Uncharacterized protein n=1 Tax=Serratia marcescens TaxID=615 RepID=A0A1Q4NY97_SERMA|nr:hypothetical protein BHU62_15945 [Serratia marcescens]